MPELWERALEARRRAKDSWRKKAGRKGGYAGRVHRKPKVGDIKGDLVIVKDLGSGRKGRADCSFLIECRVCGCERVVYEFNLRKITGRCSVQSCVAAANRTRKSA